MQVGVVNSLSGGSWKEKWILGGISLLEVLPRNRKVKKKFLLVTWWIVFLALLNFGVMIGIFWIALAYLSCNLSGLPLVLITNILFALKKCFCTHCSYLLQNTSMGETEDTGIHKSTKNGGAKAFGPAIPTFFVQLPHKFQNSLSQLKKLIKGGEEANSASSDLRKERELCGAFEIGLEKQLQAWKENPSWVDQPPEIKVTVPKGSLSLLNVKVNVGLPPDEVYNIVSDPDNKKIFKNIKEVKSRKVILDEGLRQVVELEQAALWKFLWWSGTFSVNLLVDQNRQDHSMKFKQIKTGFMKNFEGCWRVGPALVDEKMCFPFKPKTLADYYSCTGGKGRIGSNVSLEQLIQPAIVPPPPISWYLRGITTKTTEMIIQDLLTEAARIRGHFNAANSGEHHSYQGLFDEDAVNRLCDIKERWALRRRISKQKIRRQSAE